MTIKIWRAFSCNNSSSFRLVARFADTATARATAAELLEFFEAQAARDAAPGGYRDDDGALTTLARTYGFDWQGDGAGRDDDGPHVCVEGEVLVVYHAYCLGLGPGVPAFLTDRGAQVEAQRASLELQMSLLLRAAPGVDPRLDEDLAMLFAQLPDENGEVRPLRAPWSSAIHSSGRFLCYRDAGTVGLWVPVDPEDLHAVKAWLARHGIEDAVLRIEEPGDQLLFETLVAARCTACNGSLEYLDPRLHDIEMPQLVCTPCGGFYDLAAFLPVSP